MPLTLVTRNVSEACKAARQFERRGQYRAAAEQLGYFWKSVHERPNTNGLSTPEAAELLLCAGRLAGWMGAVDQHSEGQTHARDLLCEALRLLETPAKKAECRNALAVTYYREGDFIAAKVTAEAALKECPRDSAESAALINTIASIDVEQGRFHVASEFLKKHYQEVLNSKAAQERCTFHNQFGLIYKKLGEAEIEEKKRQEYLNAALIEYDGALGLFIELGHESNQAIVKNNLASVLTAMHLPRRAHVYIKEAIEYAKSIQNNSLLGAMEDTRAKILLEENNLTGALVAIKSSLAYLRGGDHLALLSGSETTHAIILARMGDVDCAESAFAHAIELADMAQIGTIKIRLTRLRELMEHHKSEALRFEKEWVQLALDASEGQPTNAARLIGISHQNMNNKITRFGLEASRVPPKTRNTNKKKTA